jgi:hypothetical protein
MRPAVGAAEATAKAAETRPLKQRKQSPAAGGESEPKVGVKPSAQHFPEAVSGNQSGTKRKQQQQHANVSVPKLPKTSKQKESKQEVEKRKKLEQKERHRKAATEERKKREGGGAAFCGTQLGDGTSKKRPSADKTVAETSAQRAYRLGKLLQGTSAGGDAFDLKKSLKYITKLGGFELDMLPESGFVQQLIQSLTTHSDTKLSEAAAELLGKWKPSLSAWNAANSKMTRCT